MAGNEQEVSVCAANLPDVPLLKIFSLLGVRERIRCAQVCRRWNSLIASSSPWKTLSLTYNDCIENMTEEMLCHDSSRCCEQHRTRRWFLIDGGYVKINDTPAELMRDKVQEFPVRRVISEYKLLIGCLENILPRVGPAIRNLRLTENGALNDYVFNLFLMLCPNVEIINAQHTALSIKAFNGLSQYGSCRKIRHLNLMGCDKIIDSAICNLVKCWNSEIPQVPKDKEKTVNVPYIVDSIDTIYVGFITTDSEICEVLFGEQEGASIKTFTCPPTSDSSEIRGGGLKALSLAGCHNLTDKSLIFLANCKYVASLEWLDVSGCTGFTSKGLSLLVKACPNLKPSKVFYCDRIEDGPFSKEANGCQTEGGVCCMH